MDNSDDDDDESEAKLPQTPRSKIRDGNLTPESTTDSWKKDMFSDDDDNSNGEKFIPPTTRSALPPIQAGNLTPQSTTDSWKKDMFSDDDHEDLVATINLPSTSSSSSNTNTPAVNSPSKSVTDVDDTLLTDDDDDDEYSCVSDHSSIPPLHRRKILRPISPSDSEISCLTDMLAKCTSPSSSNTNTPVNSPCESVTDVDDTVLTDDDDDEDNCESDHSSIPPLQRRAILKPISPLESEISSLTDMLAKCTSPSSSNTNTPVNSPCKSVTGVDDTVLTDDDDDDENISGSNDTAIPLHQRTISRPIRPSESEICNLPDSMAKCTSPSTSNTNTPVNSSNNSYSNSTTTNVSSQTTHENDHDDGKDKFIPYKIKPTPWSPSNINFVGYNELTATRSSSFIESKPFNYSQSQSSDQQSSIDIQKKNINTCSNQKRLCKACGRKSHGTKFSQKCIKNVDNIPLAKRLEKTKLTQANKIDKIKNSKSKEAKALRQFNYQKKKRVGKLKSGQEKYSTIKSIKMSLNRIIKNQEVKKIIIDDIKVLSKLFNEFSYFVSFCFNHEQNEAINDIEKLTNKKQFHLSKYLNKLTYFRKKKAKKEEDFIDRLFKQYQIIRNEVGMPIEGYCGDLRTNLISMNLINFETNFMNNIIVNCRVRIGKYLKIVGKIFNRRKRKKMLDNLFYKNIKPKDKDNKIMDIFNDLNLNFTEIKYKWWKFMGFFKKLSNIDLMNFPLTPIYKPGLKHFMYSTSSVWQLAIKAFGNKNQKLVRDWSTQKKMFNNNYYHMQKFIWKQCFKIKKKLIKKKFNFTISTNGVTVTIHLMKEIINNNCNDNNLSKKKLKTTVGAAAVTSSTTTTTTATTTATTTCSTDDNISSDEEDYDDINVLYNYTDIDENNDDNNNINNNNNIIDDNDDNSNRISDEEYDRGIGLDPGNKNIIGGVIVQSLNDIGNKDKEERYLLTSKALLHKSGHYTRQFVIKKLIKNVEKEKKQVYDQFVEIKKQEFENIVGEIEAEYIKKRKTKKERKQLKQQKIENNTKHDDDGKTRNWKKCKQLLKNKKNNNVVPSESAEPAPPIEPLEPSKLKKNSRQMIRKKTLLENFVINKPDNYVLSAKYRLICMKLEEPVYSSRRYVRLQFDKFIRTNEAVSKEVNYLEHGTYDGKKTSQLEKKTLICGGQFQISKYMRGYPSAPSSLLKKKLQENKKIKLIIVDEFRTTILCNKCNNPCVTSKSPHRYQYCSNCKITFNRDINGGSNIFRLGVYRTDGTYEYLVPQPLNFTRSVQVAVAAVV